MDARYAYKADDFRDTSGRYPRPPLQTPPGSPPSLEARVSPSFRGYAFLFSLEMRSELKEEKRKKNCGVGEGNP